MPDLSRRALFALGGAGVALVAVGGCGSVDTFEPSGASGASFSEPPVLVSQNGRLEADLRAAWDVRLTQLDGTVAGYNGSTPGPTLRLRPGDTLGLRLTNALDEPTNLHTHGLHVSPEGNGDNPFRMVMPGETATYEIVVPDDHPAGTFWYHPHHHGLVADQLSAGLYGAIVVVGETEPPVTRERLLMVSDLTLGSDGRPSAPSAQERMRGREGNTVLVNGQVRPRLEVASGATERWRVLNACVSRFLRLRVDGLDVTVIGYDGIPTAPVAVAEIALAPGNRADLLVRGGGETTLRTLAVNRGSLGMMGGTITSPAVTLADVVTARGTPGAATDVARWRPAEPEDLRAVAVDRTRTLSFTMGMGMGMGGMGGMTFGFDGLGFDESRVDQSPSLGDVEEWVVRNTTPMDHPFHLHVWPMQLIEGPGGEAPEPVWRDVVNVPAGAQVRVRIAFRDIGGRTVYHCHILDHEDLGMMGVVQVT